MWQSGILICSGYDTMTLYSVLASFYSIPKCGKYFIKKFVNYCQLLIVPNPKYILTQLLTFRNICFLPEF